MNGKFSQNGKLVRMVKHLGLNVSIFVHNCGYMVKGSSTIVMKSTKVQTLGGIWWKYWNIWIENTFACIRIIVLGIYRTSFQHNLHCFINACVHVIND